MKAPGSPDLALIAACRMAAAVSGISVLALLLFYAVELRSSGTHLFGPISDISTAREVERHGVPVQQPRPSLPPEEIPCPTSPASTTSP